MNCSYATSLAATRSFLLVNLLAVSAPLAPLTDPTNGLTVVNLTAAPFGGETFQTNRNGCGPVSNRHGSFHGPITGVLRLNDWFWR